MWTLKHKVNLVVKVLLRLFGLQELSFHSQQDVHHGNLPPSFIQYIFAGLPSPYTAPGQPFGCKLPFGDVGRTAQSMFGAAYKNNIFFAPADIWDTSILYFRAKCPISAERRKYMGKDNIWRCISDMLLMAITKYFTLLQSCAIKVFISFRQKGLPLIHVRLYESKNIDS